MVTGTGQGQDNPTESAEPPIDLTVLEGLVTQLGESGPGMRRMLLDTYLVDGGPRMAELQTAAARGDLGRVQDVAHAMKSSSALLGVLPLAKLLQEVEDAARAGDPDVRPLTERAAAEYERVVAAIKSTMDGGE